MNLRNWTLPKILFVLSGALVSYIYFRVAPLRADPHHDGVILSAAIGVSEGRDVLSQVFSQYGPLPPMVNSVFISVFGSQLLILRYFAAFQSLLLGVLIFANARRVSSNWVAVVLSLFWLFCSSVWSTAFPGALVCWPSMLASIFVLTGILFLTTKNKARETFYNFAGGIFLGLAGFCRIQALAIVPLLALITFIKFPDKRKDCQAFIGGYLVSVCSLVTYMFLENSLDDFVNQVLLTPFSVYTETGAEQNHNLFQLPMYIIKAAVFIILLVLAHELHKNTKSIVKAVSFLLPILTFLIYLGLGVHKLIIPVRAKVIFGEPWSDLLLSPYYFSAVTTVLILFFWVKFKELRLSWSESIFVVTACIELIQLYPQPDVMHLWWISPCTILTIPISAKIMSSLKVRGIVSKEIQSAISNKQSFQILMVSLSILGASSAMLFIHRPWLEFSLPVMRGTYSTADIVLEQKIFDIIPQYALKNLSSFDCKEGIYSVSNGKYLAKDQWFVNWGNTSKERQQTGDVRFICNKPKSYAINYSNSHNMSLVYYNEDNNRNSIAVLKKNG